MVTRTPPLFISGSGATCEVSARRRLMISTISRCDSPPDGRIVTLASLPLFGSRAVTERIDSTSTVITSSTRVEPGGPGVRSSRTTWPSLRFFSTSCESP